MKVMGVFLVQMVVMVSQVYTYHILHINYIHPFVCQPCLTKMVGVCFLKKFKKHTPTNFLKKYQRINLYSEGSLTLRKDLIKLSVTDVLVYAWMH